MDTQKLIAKVTNDALSTLLGVENNWYGIIIGMAKKRSASNGYEIANDVTTEIILLLEKKDENNKFWMGIAPIIERKDKTELVKYFTSACYLRIRRYLTLEKRSLLLSELFLDIPDKIHDEELVIGEMVHSIIDELDRMSQAAIDKRTTERLKIAKEVARVRLANPPEFVPLSQLMEAFPSVGKTTLHVILHDIQEAYRHVA